MLKVVKKKLVRVKAFPVWGSMDVTENNRLLVRVKGATKYWIRVIHRLTGSTINDIPSACANTTQVNKHPRHPDYVLESCSTCEEIRAYNIKTTGKQIVHRGSKIIRLFDGPDGSLIVVDMRGALSRLVWEKGPLEEVRLEYIREVPSKRFQKEFVRLCYVECHGVLICTVKDREEDYELLAVRLGSRSIAWRLFGPVEGRLFQPGSETCDSDGNAYVSDRMTNRILKIDGLTGEILSILLVEDGDKMIQSMRWSNTVPNLILSRGKQISTYFIRN